MNLQATTHPDRKSFLAVSENSHFPIQNLPYGVFQRTQQADAPPRCGVAIGEYVLDLSVLQEANLLPEDLPADIFAQASLNGFAGLERRCWQATRCAVSELLDSECQTLRDNSDLRQRAIIAQSDVSMLLPMTIGDYTDFYASREHATNVGTMFRGKDAALNPNWLHLPVGYHGRASSVVVSGTPVQRPLGQTMSPETDAPTFGPCRAMDFELEMGFFIGPETQLGQTVPIDRAEDRIFGLVLVNDWSARDIQRWEYVPLGPFLGKSFCTSISPWVVTLDALEPFRCNGPAQDPQPLEYLHSQHPKTFDIQLEVNLNNATLESAHTISRSNFKYLYWNMSQQLAHHTSNGCNVRTGDLMASGTISGPTPESLGCMLELAWNRQRPVELPNGESRVMLHDGDEVSLCGWAQGDGYRIGFGDVVGEIQARPNNE